MARCLHALRRPSASASSDAVDAPSLTRRRALALGAAAGLSSLLPARRPGVGARVAAPRASASTSRAGASAPRAHRRCCAPGALRPARRARRGRERAGLEVRVRARGGRWSPWVPLGAGGDHRPDTRHRRARVRPGLDRRRATSSSCAAARRPARRCASTSSPVPAAARRRGARAAAASRTAAPPRPARAPRSSRAPRGAPTRCRRAATPGYGEVQVAFVHHTVTANDYAPEDSAGDRAGASRSYHRDTNGWNDIGYNFLVDKYGQIFEGRAGGIDQAVIGAQAQGYNAHSTGISNIGTFTDVAQTDAALDAIARADRLEAARCTARRSPARSSSPPAAAPTTATAGHAGHARAHQRPPRRRRDRRARATRSTPSCPTCARGRWRSRPSAPVASASIVLDAFAAGGRLRPGAAAERRRCTAATASAVAGQPVQVQKQGTAAG